MALSTRAHKVQEEARQRDRTQQKRETQLKDMTGSHAPVTASLGAAGGAAFGVMAHRCRRLPWANKAWPE